MIVEITETTNDYDCVTPEWWVRLDGELVAICYSRKLADLLVAAMVAEGI